jgi:hypothetical protein
LELGVPERRTNVAMAQHALDDLYTLALSDELAGPRMPQLVWRSAENPRRRPVRRPARPGPLVVQRVVGHAGAAIRQKHHLVVGGRRTPMCSSCRASCHPSAVQAPRRRMPVSQQGEHQLVRWGLTGDGDSQRALLLVLRIGRGRVQRPRSGASSASGLCVHKPPRVAHATRWRNVATRRPTVLVAAVPRTSQASRSLWSSSGSGRRNRGSPGRVQLRYELGQSWILRATLDSSGPLTTRPDLWDRGIATRLLEPTMDFFARLDTPRTRRRARRVPRSHRRHLRRLEVSNEIRAVHGQGLGDTVLNLDGSRLACFPICHGGCRWLRAPVGSARLNAEDRR